MIFTRAIMSNRWNNALTVVDPLDKVDWKCISNVAKAIGLYRH